MCIQEQTHSLFNLIGLHLIAFVCLHVCYGLGFCVFIFHVKHVEFMTHTHSSPTSNVFVATGKTALQQQAVQIWAISILFSYRPMSDAQGWSVRSHVTVQSNGELWWIRNRWQLGLLSLYLGQQSFPLSLIQRVVKKLRFNAQAFQQTFAFHSICKNMTAC